MTCNSTHFVKLTLLVSIMALSAVAGEELNRALLDTCSWSKSDSPPQSAIDLLRQVHGTRTDMLLDRVDKAHLSLGVNRVLISEKQLAVSSLSITTYFDSGQETFPPIFYRWKADNGRIEIEELDLPDLQGENLKFFANLQAGLRDYNVEIVEGLLGDTSQTTAWILQGLRMRQSIPILHTSIESWPPFMSFYNVDTSGIESLFLKSTFLNGTLQQCVVSSIPDNQGDVMFSNFIDTLSWSDGIVVGRVKSLNGKYVFCGVDETEYSWIMYEGAENLSQFSPDGLIYMPFYLRDGKKLLISNVANELVISTDSYGNGDEIISTLSSLQGIHDRTSVKQFIVGHILSKKELFPLHKVSIDWLMDFGKNKIIFINLRASALDYWIGIVRDSTISKDARRSVLDELLKRAKKDTKKKIIHVIDTDPLVSEIAQGNFASASGLNEKVSVKVAHEIDLKLQRYVNDSEYDAATDLIKTLDSTLLSTILQKAFVTFSLRPFQPRDKSYNNLLLSIFDNHQYLREETVLEYSDVSAERTLVCAMAFAHHPSESSISYLHHFLSLKTLDDNQYLMLEQITYPVLCGLNDQAGIKLTIAFIKEKYAHLPVQEKRNVLHALVPNMSQTCGRRFTDMDQVLDYLRNKVRK